MKHQPKWYLLLVLCCVPWIGGCKKETSEPAQKRFLLEKVYLDGNLYMHLHYDDEPIIKRITYYRSNGDIAGDQEILLDEQGRVKEIRGDHGHYTSRAVTTYEQGLRTQAEVVQEAKDGSFQTTYTRTYEYPPGKIVVHLSGGDGAPAYTIAYTIADDGKIEKIERQDLRVPVNSYSQTFVYDKGKSMEGYIEDIIPGYHDLPVHHINLRTTRTERASGDIDEVSHRNELDSQGNLIRSVATYRDGGTEEFSFQYREISD
ncbi:MAG: hypothetical protein FWJ85_00820 [Solitalea sp.]